MEEIKSNKEAIEVADRYNLDGVLIGQGANGNPWVFSDHKPTEEEKLEVLFEHSKLAEEFYGEKGFVTVRKHLAWYCKGIDGSKKLRSQLVRACGYNDVLKIIQEFKNES